MTWSGIFTISCAAPSRATLPTASPRRLRPGRTIPPTGVDLDVGGSIEVTILESWRQGPADGRKSTHIFCSFVFTHEPENRPACVRGNGGGSRHDGCICG